jgi:hypothetical protein
MTCEGPSTKKPVYEVRGGCFRWKEDKILRRDKRPRLSLIAGLIWEPMTFKVLSSPNKTWHGWVGLLFTPFQATDYPHIGGQSIARKVLSFENQECLIPRLTQLSSNRTSWFSSWIVYTRLNSFKTNERLWVNSIRWLSSNIGVVPSQSDLVPPDHLLLDSSPNLRPLISCWEINKFENWWYKSVRNLEVLKLLFPQFLKFSSFQRDMSGPKLEDMSKNRWSFPFMVRAMNIWQNYAQTMLSINRFVAPIDGCHLKSRLTIRYEEGWLPLSAKFVTELASFIISAAQFTFGWSWKQGNCLAVSVYVQQAFSNQSLVSEIIIWSYLTYMTIPKPVEIRVQNCHMHSDCSFKVTSWISRTRERGWTLVWKTLVWKS